ncbi:MAG: nucleotidyltransferase family protein [Gammaproteobacteria bacterium]
MEFGGVVLAAGLSSRMAPVNKLLISLGDRPLIQHVVQAALDGGLDPVTVVSGYDREAVHAAVAGLPVRIVGNDDYEEGLASSIRAGVAAIAADVDAALFLLGDMPLVTPRHLRPLLVAFAPAEGHSICVPTYRTRRGNPVLWGAQYFPHLLQLSGDEGARVLFPNFADQIAEVDMPDDAALVDIDTQAALNSVRFRFEQAEVTQSDPPQTSASLSAF